LFILLLVYGKKHHSFDRGIWCMLLSFAFKVQVQFIALILQTIGTRRRVNKPFSKKGAGLFLSVIMLTEIQELLHAAVYITSSSPDHTCLRMNLRDERDTCNFGKEREHILIEETAAAALLHEL
jgi:hypothetical protein